MKSCNSFLAIGLWARNKLSSACAATDKVAVVLTMMEHRISGASLDASSFIAGHM